MNKEQADKIIAVIEKDATGMGHYFPTEDTECVLGGLWLAAGGLRNITALQEGISDTLEKHYGIYNTEFVALYRMNDDYDTVERRRPALIALVKSWIKEE